jgi:alcohol dehydrogenase/propanol-preferring alcohol dehydrogenase
MELVLGRITVVGVSPGPRHLLREMLRFHEAIGARTIVEVYFFDRAAEALDRVIEGSVRFRAVLIPDA